MSNKPIRTRSGNHLFPGHGSLSEPHARLSQQPTCACNKPLCTAKRGIKSAQKGTKMHTCMALIWGTRASATVSGSSARALKNLRATGDASLSNKSVSTMPGERLWTPMLRTPAQAPAESQSMREAHVLSEHHNGSLVLSSRLCMTARACQSAACLICAFWHCSFWRQDTMTQDTQPSKYAAGQPPQKYAVQRKLHKTDNALARPCIYAQPFK